MYRCGDGIARATVAREWGVTYWGSRDWAHHVPCVTDYVLRRTGMGVEILAEAFSLRGFRYPIVWRKLLETGRVGRHRFEGSQHVRQQEPPIIVEKNFIYTQHLGVKNIRKNNRRQRRPGQRSSMRGMSFSSLNQW